MASRYIHRANTPIIGSLAKPIGDKRHPDSTYRVFRDPMPVSGSTKKLPSIVRTLLDALWLTHVWVVLVPCNHDSRRARDQGAI